MSRERSRYLAASIGFVVLLSACESIAAPPPSTATTTTTASRPGTPSTITTTSPPRTTTTTQPSTTTTTEPPPLVLERSESDRADDYVGMYQVHVVYAVPMDRDGIGRDLDGTIANSVRLMNDWLARFTDGATIRFDTFQGKLDITFVRLPIEHDALYAEGAWMLNKIDEILDLSGYLKPNKLYLVYYEGDHAVNCADGAYPPYLVGQVVAVYPAANPVGQDVPCSAFELGASDHWPGYLDFAGLHEIMHGLGFNAACGTNHHLRGHTDDDPRDLMWTGDIGYWDNENMLLDPGNDDYYRHDIPDCPDLSDSAFLDPLPADPQIPPGFLWATWPGARGAANRPQ